MKIGKNFSEELERNISWIFIWLETWHRHTRCISDTNATTDNSFSMWSSMHFSQCVNFLDVLSGEINLLSAHSKCWVQLVYVLVLRAAYQRKTGMTMLKVHFVSLTIEELTKNQNTTHWCSYFSHRNIISHLVLCKALLTFSTWLTRCYFFLVIFFSLAKLLLFCQLRFPLGCYFLADHRKWPIARHSAA